MIPEVQRETAAFLERLAGKPPVETHISAVFIGPQRAWKLKKAVLLPFLNFSTPVRRRHFVMHEFEINHAMAPELYLAARGIARLPNGALQFCAAEASEAIEWVLEMQTIPADDFLDKVAARGALTPALCGALGDMAARLHEVARVVQNSDEMKRAQGLIDELVRNGPSAGLERAAVEHWHAGAQVQLRANMTLLKTRALAGHVRRGHGDLHLGNLCLWHGTVLPTDALEFDEALATIDTGYDLAFLLMDIETRAGRTAANTVFNRYMARSGDFTLLPMLPLWLSQRAMIRAYVLALRKHPEYKTYLRAALGYLHPPAAPVIAIGGFQGTGKTTLARALAPALGPAPGALVLRSDELRKRLHAVLPETRLPQEAYSPQANAALNAALREATTKIVTSAHGLIIDASFLDLALRADVEQLVRDAGRSWLGLWLEAPMPILIDRLKHRQGDASDAGPEVLRNATRHNLGPITWHRLDATDKTRLLDDALTLIWPDRKLHQNQKPPGTTDL